LLVGAVLPRRVLEKLASQRLQPGSTTYWCARELPCDSTHHRWQWAPSDPRQVKYSRHSLESVSVP